MRKKLTFIDHLLCARLLATSHFLKIQYSQVSCEVDNINSTLKMRPLRLREVKQLAHSHPVLGFAFGPDSNAFARSLSEHELLLGGAEKHQQDGTFIRHFLSEINYLNPFRPVPGTNSKELTSPVLDQWGFVSLSSTGPF